MDVFLENAQRLFDVARSADSGEPNDFALLVHPDGGLHFVMESALESMHDEESTHNEPARTIYRVTRTAAGRVRVAGRSGAQECTIEQHARLSCAGELLRDHPLYWISSPVTTCAGS